MNAYGNIDFVFSSDCYASVQKWVIPNPHEFYFLGVMSGLNSFQTIPVFAPRVLLMLVTCLRRNKIVIITITFSTSFHCWGISFQKCSKNSCTLVTNRYFYWYIRDAFQLFIEEWRHPVYHWVCEPVFLLRCCIMRKSVGTKLLITTSIRVWLDNPLAIHLFLVEMKSIHLFAARLADETHISHVHVKWHFFLIRALYQVGL